MTLVEVVGAVFVLAIGIVGACLLVTQCRELQAQAGSHYTAINIGRNMLERARAMPYSTLYTLTNENYYVDSSGDRTTLDLADYRRITVVSNVPGRTNLTEVIVTVQIKNRKTLAFGASKEVIRSLFTKYRGE